MYFADNMRVKAFFSLLLALSIAGTAIAQMIHGEALGMTDRQPLAEVTITNIHNDISITTPENGSFAIVASAGQLLEFRKKGYKVTRVRVPDGFMPSFFRIIMEQTVTPPSEMYADKGWRYDSKEDSIAFHDLYEQQLNYPRMSTFEKIRSPFSALSKQNRMTWQFQEDYSRFEKEKYVDFTFNKELITKVTGLTGDSLDHYMRRFRPTYEQLRAMNDYAYFTFIKGSVHRFRNVTQPRGAQ